MAATGKWLTLDDVAADARGALDRAAQPCLFDRLDWFRLTDRYGIAPGSAEVSRAGDAWLFLGRTGRRRAAPLASWYSLGFGPIGAPGDWDALFRTVAQRFDAIALHPVCDAMRAPVEAALARAGWRAFATRASTNWRIEVAEQDFTAYWAARPGALRSTVARRTKSHPVETVVLDRFDAQAWQGYERVYTASWKPEEGSLPFLRALAEQEGAAGALRLGLALAPSGEAVAAQFWLVENGVATIHKLAHREDARAGSPGSLLSHAMFAHAIDRDRVRTIDFGLGDEPYKADWMDDPRPVWRIDAYRPLTVTGFLGMAREHASRLARRVPNR